MIYLIPAPEVTRAEGEKNMDWCQTCLSCERITYVHTETGEKVTVSACQNVEYCNDPKWVKISSRSCWDA